MIGLRLRFVRGIRREEGFTLIEMMAALGMFAVVLVSMGLMFETAFRTARIGRDRDIARNLAQQKIEELRLLPYFVPFSDQDAGTDPDLFDRYFVDLGAGLVTRTVDGVGVQQHYDSSRLGYVTFETFSASPTVMPVGFTRETLVQFVDVAATPVSPPAGYDSNANGSDVPFTTTKMTVTLAWRDRQRPQSFSVNTVIRGIAQSPLNASAKVSALAGALTSLQFTDGLLPGVVDIAGEIGLARSEGVETETNEVRALAEAIFAQIAERDPVSNEIINGTQLILDAGPASASQTGPGGLCPSDQVVTGTAGEDLVAVNPDLLGAPVTMAGAGQSDAAACTQVGTSHGLSPESESTVVIEDFVANFGDTAGSPPALEQVRIGTITLTTRVISTSVPGDITAFGEVMLEDITIWGTHQAFLTHTTDGNSYEFANSLLYAGILKVDEIGTTVTVSANGTPGGTTARVKWSWDNLRVWDPTNDGTPSAYAPGSSCSYDSGPTSPPAALPACVFIITPAEYGLDENASLQITVGSTQSTQSVDGSQASASQKNVMSVFVRSLDFDMEPVTLNLGDLASEVSYKSHTH